MRVPFFQKRLPQPDPPRVINLPEVCEGEILLKVPQDFRRGDLKHDERKSIESAFENLRQIAELTERPDWSDLRVLDFGCGVKFSQALLQCDVSVKQYVGMDVYREMISFLQEQVHDPRYAYHVVPFHNEMYNPTGIPLSAGAELPEAGGPFDLITLQSVFTHVTPQDFLALLQVLRKAAAPNARLFFTCFINQEMEQDFLDSEPDKPLLRAYYRESFIREMLEQSHWNPLALHPPERRCNISLCVSPV